MNGRRVFVQKRIPQSKSTRTENEGSGLHKEITMNIDPLNFIAEGHSTAQE